MNADPDVREERNGKQGVICKQNLTDVVKRKTNIIIIVFFSSMLLLLLLSLFYMLLIQQPSRAHRENYNSNEEL